MLPSCALSKRAICGFETLALFLLNLGAENPSVGSILTSTTGEQNVHHLETDLSPKSRPSILLVAPICMRILLPRAVQWKSTVKVPLWPLKVLLSMITGTPVRPEARLRTSWHGCWGFISFFGLPARLVRRQRTVT